MISRFTNLFKKNDEDEQRAFQSKVLKSLKEIFPDKAFSRSDDPLVINLGEQQLGLTNLRSNYLLTLQTEKDFRELVIAHFGQTFANLDLVEPLSWDEAKEQLMPQLMPAEYLEKLQLVSFPFGEEVVLGFVIDREQTYSYVTMTDTDRWDIGELEIYQRSLDNLDERSKGIEATVVPGPNSFVVINTLDGFDAVRIISSNLQGFFSEHIGIPFYFGVPNRDFLVCWSKYGDSEFQRYMRSQISSDFDERPYPLSRHVFEVDGNGKIVHVEPSPADLRASLAENN